MPIGFRVLPLADAGTPTPAEQFSWRQPLAEPTRLRALATAVVVAAGLSWCPTTPAPAETITADKWHRPLAEPTRAKGPASAQQAATALVKAAPFEETVSADRWLRSLSEPVRTRATQPAAAIFAPYVEVAAETVTLDKYHAPLSLPTRARQRIEAAGPQFIALDVALFRWLAPLSEPMRIRPAQRPAAAVLVQASPFAETVSLDRWAQPLAEPVRLRPALRTGAQPHIAFVKTAPFPETTDAGKWFAALSEPQRPRLGLAVHLQRTLALWPHPIVNADAPVGFYGVYPDRAPGRTLATAQRQALAFVKAAPFAESITADRWAQPPSQPTRRIASVAGVPANFAGPALPVVASPDRWWQAFTQPRALVRAQPTTPALVAVVAAAGETVTLDKWFALWQQPARVRHRQPGIVAGSPFAEVSAAAWWRQFNQPAARRASVSGHQSVGAVLATVSGPDRWWTAFSKPVLRALRQTAGAAVPVYFSATGDAGDIAWFAALSEPTRPIWTVAWRQTAIVPVFFNAGLATPRTGTGAITIGGGSAGLSDARDADGLASARGADGLAVARSSPGLASARDPEGLATPRS